MSYRLYVDEVGNDDLGHAHEEPHRFLSLTGVAITLDHARQVLTPQMAQLKAEIFQHDPDVPLILHRTDIVAKKKAFGILRDAEIRQTFDDRIIQMMADVECTVITAVIDKLDMMDQEHWNQRHPYHYLMEILVEKYAQFLRRKHSTGDIMPEKRRGRPDTELQAAFTAVRNNGTNFVHHTVMQERIPSSQLKFRAKDENVAGLQLCDLLAHPSYIHVRREMGHAVIVGPFAGRVVEVLVSQKYDRSWNGRIRGYGTKYLP